MLHKSFKIAETKADGKTGTFEALVSVFGNVDSVGDRILHGAYTETLKKWRESGDPIPIILSHQWDNPMAHIGVADPQDVKQTPDGLLVKGKLDIEDNDVAKQVYRLMKRRSLKEFSIGYRVPAGGEAHAEDGANDITEIDLVEVGPTLKGANSQTELRAIKSAIVGEDEPPRAEAELRRQAEKLEQKAIADNLPEGLPPDPEPSPIAKALESVTEQLAALQSKMDEPTEADLRRRTDDLERKEIEPTLPPEVEPGPDPIAEALKELGTELTALKAEVHRPSEGELQRLSERLERALTAEQLPPATSREQEEMEQLKSTVVELMGELTKVKAQLATAGEEDQRRRAERLERERLAAELPPEVQQPDPRDEELESLKATLAEQTTVLEDMARKLETPSEDDQRRRMEREERKAISEKLPPPAPDTEALKAVQEQLAGVAASMEKMREEISTPSEEEQRRRIAREERERILAELPTPPTQDTKHEELEALQAQLAVQTAALEALTQKLDTPSEEDQRRRTERLERERLAAALPPAVPQDADNEELQAQLAEQTAALEALALKLDTPTEEEQRRRVARQERERILAELPPATPPNDEEVGKLKTVMTGMLAELQAMHEKIEAPTEEQLRRRSLKLEREEIEKDLPPPTRQELEELQRLQKQLADMSSVMEDMQKQLNTPSEEDQRRRSERLERELLAGKLPDSVEPESNEEVEQLKQDMSKLAAEVILLRQAPSEQELRRRAEAHTQEEIAKDLPPATDPRDERLAELEKQLAEKGEELRASEEKLAAPDELELRRRARKADREIAEDKLPKGPGQVELLKEQLAGLEQKLTEARSGKRLVSDLRMQLEEAGRERFGTSNGYVYVDDFDPEQHWAVFCVESSGDYRYVKVAYMTEGLNDITLGTEEVEVERATTYQPAGKSAQEQAAVKQEPTRARDPLRERSDQTVLEIQSGGASLRKPPAKKQVPQKEPIDEADLRKRSYKEMFDLLTEG